MAAGGYGRAPPAVTFRTLLELVAVCVTADPPIGGFDIPAGSRSTGTHAISIICRKCIAMGGAWLWADL